MGEHIYTDFIYDMKQTNIINQYSNGNKGKKLMHAAISRIEKYNRDESNYSMKYITKYHDNIPYKDNEDKHKPSYTTHIVD